MNGLERIACPRCSVREERTRHRPDGPAYECKTCGHRWKQAWTVVHIVPWVDPKKDPRGDA